MSQMKMVRKASLHSALERERSAEAGGGPRCSSPNDTYVSGSLWMALTVFTSQ